MQKWHIGNKKCLHFKFEDLWYLGFHSQGIPIRNTFCMVFLINSLTIKVRWFNFYSFFPRTDLQSHFCFVFFRNGGPTYRVIFIICFLGGWRTYRFIFAWIFRKCGSDLQNHIVGICFRQMVLKTHICRDFSEMVVRLTESSFFFENGVRLRVSFFFGGCTYNTYRVIFYFFSEVGVRLKESFFGCRILGPLSRYMASYQLRVSTQLG